MSDPHSQYENTKRTSFIDAALAGNEKLRGFSPYHTIADDCGLGDAPHSSDGPVLYRSSHLPDGHIE